jgi:hypothetical protein
MMLQFLDWVARRPRTYAEAMDAWRSSCPRLTVWEDALIGGFIQLNAVGAMQQGEVALTPRGRAILDESRVRGPVQISPPVSAEPAATPDPAGM